jgi:serine protease
MRFASTRGAVLVASTGNDEPHSCVTMPAADAHAIAVGGTTEDGCVGSYSKVSPRVDLVAPGGGLPGLGCTPSTQDRPIYQLTFRVGQPKQFDIPGDYEGTSMSAAHVSGTAALVIASGVLGPAPTPAQVLARLQQTARDLGTPGKDSSYGAGLINAAAATTP